MGLFGKLYAGMLVPDTEHTNIPRMLLCLVTILVLILVSVAGFLFICDTKFPLLKSQYAFLIIMAVTGTVSYVFRRKSDYSYCGILYTFFFYFVSSIFYAGILCFVVFGLYNVLN